MPTESLIVRDYRRSKGNEVRAFDLCPKMRTTSPEVRKRVFDDARRLIG
jgi:hypothetical protein